LPALRADPEKVASRKDKSSILFPTRKSSIVFSLKPLFQDAAGGNDPE
jgi:hypothetical protein